MPYVPMQVTEADYHPSIWQRLRHLWWRLIPGSFERSCAKSAAKEELEAQRRSFAYGNCKLANENVTREMIDQEAAKLKDK